MGRIRGAGRQHQEARRPARGRAGAGRPRPLHQQGLHLVRRGCSPRSSPCSPTWSAAWWRPARGRTGAASPAWRSSAARTPTPAVCRASSRTPTAASTSSWPRTGTGTAARSRRRPCPSTAGPSAGTPWSPAAASGGGAGLWVPLCFLFFFFNDSGIEIEIM